MIKIALYIIAGIALAMYKPLFGVIYLICFICLYILWCSNRENVFKNIAKKRRFISIDPSNVAMTIVSSQLDIFSKASCKVKRVIKSPAGKDMSIYLADITIIKEGAEMGASYGRYRRRPGNRNGIAAIIDDTVCVVIDKNLYLPAASLYPESLLEKMIAMVGGQDIDFDDDPEFSDKYTLQGKSIVNVMDFFTRPVRKGIMNTLPSGCIIEMAEDRFLIRTGGVAPQYSLNKMIDVAEKLHKVFLGSFHP